MSTDLETAANSGSTNTRQQRLSIRAGRLARRYTAGLIVLLLLLSLALNALLWRRVERLQFERSFILVAGAVHTDLHIRLAYSSIAHALDQLAAGEHEHAARDLTDAIRYLSGVSGALKVYGTARGANNNLSNIIGDYEYTISMRVEHQLSYGQMIPEQRIEDLEAIMQDLAIFLRLFPKEVLIQANEAEGQRLLREFCRASKFRARHGLDGCR